MATKLCLYSQRNGKQVNDRPLPTNKDAPKGKPDYASLVVLLPDRAHVDWLRSKMDMNWAHDFFESKPSGRGHQWAWCCVAPRYGALAVDYTQHVLESNNAAVMRHLSRTCAARTQIHKNKPLGAHS